jgi:hypothetical protein
MEWDEYNPNLTDLKMKANRASEFVKLQIISQHAI